MKVVLWNILAVVAGLVVGGVVNGGMVWLGSVLAPTPPGVDFSDPDSVRAMMEQLGFQHYLFPFLAHALGTLAGAWVTYRLARSSQVFLAMIIGVANLAGGIAAAMIIPAPLWFLVLDLGLAYVPMAWLATRLGSPRHNEERAPG
jgi:hypothetical protein